MLSGLPDAALAGTGPGPPAGEAESELRLGVRAEDEGSFARALEHYRTCLQGSPSLRLARIARNRIIWIEERSEGGFVPLAALARVRRDPGALADPAALEKLADEVESFPPGLVRSELRLRAAEARLNLRSHQAGALLGLRRVVADASAGAADRMLAERDLVEALLAAGQLDAARDEVMEYPFDTKAAAEVERMVRRRWFERGAMVASLVLLSIAGVVVARICRRGPRGSRGGRPDGTLLPAA